MSLAGRTRTALDVVSMLAVTVASVFLIWTLAIERRPKAATPPQLVQDVSGLKLKAVRFANVSGTGAIAVIEFSDFLCPFCAQHARNTLPVLQRDFVQPGRIRYVALHYPIESIHPGAERASEAAECPANQGRFWEMHQRLFSFQKAPTDVALIEHAETLGLDLKRFEACMLSNATLEGIREDQEEARRLGVNGTPTFFIGRVTVDGNVDLLKRIDGVASVEIFVKEIEAAS